MVGKKVIITKENSIHFFAKDSEVVIAEEFLIFGKMAYLADGVDKSTGDNLRQMLERSEFEPKK